jgi:hypothetical protein
MTEPRDWDKEMAEIDKVIAKAGPPAAQSPAASPAREAQPRLSTPAVRSPGVTVTRRRDTAGVWFRALLGAAGAVALPFWPYGKTCGTMLYVYMIGTAAVIAAGIWAMRGAWIHRRGVAHIAGLLVLIAGVGLAAIEIVHRTAWAAGQLHWICP